MNVRIIFLYLHDHFTLNECMTKQLVQLILLSLGGRIRVQDEQQGSHTYIIPGQRLARWRRGRG